MSKSDSFNINRLLMLIYRQVYLKYKSILISTGAMAGVIMVINLLSMYNCGCNTVNQNLFNSLSITIFFILGMVFTSTSFEEMNSSAKGCFFLTLPVSNLERLTAVWLVSSVLYFIWWIFAILIINLLIAVFAYMLMGIPFGWVELFNPTALKTYATFFIIQTVFLFGAVYFNKSNFIKTIFALFVIGLSLNIISYLFVFIIFGNVHNFGTITYYDSQYFDKLFQILKYAYWIGVAPFFLILSYVGLKERQV
jgi:hypothetical protein